MKTNNQITQDEFVLMIKMIQILDRKVEANVFTYEQEQAAQLSEMMLIFLETVMGDSEAKTIDTWLLDPVFTETVIKQDGELRDWYPETAEALYDWLTGVYDSPAYDEEEGKASELF